MKIYSGTVLNARYFKIFSLVVLLTVFARPASAQVTLFTESFEGSFPPSSWTVTNPGIGNPWSLMPSFSYAYLGSQAMQCASNQNFPANTWAFAPAIQLTQGVSYRISYWYRQGTAGYTEKMKVTIGTAATVASQTTVLHDYTAITTTTYTQGIDSFTVPANGNYVIAFQCYSSPNLNSRLLLDYIQIQQLSCSGLSTMGTAWGPTSSCSGANFNLIAPGITVLQGTSLQWQSSPPGANNFSDIPGAVTASSVVSQTSSKDYRCRVTCTNDGSVAYSNTFFVYTPAFCYCVPITTCSSYKITNVNIGSLNNSTTTCTGAGYTDFSPTLSPVTLTAGTKIPVSVTVSAGFTSFVSVWIDYNRNGVFDTDEHKSIGSANGATITDTLKLPFNLAPGATRMRVRSRSNAQFTASQACLESINGETEDYLVDIAPAKLAIFYSPFQDTLYSSILKLQANIRQTDVGVNQSDSLRPRLWIKRTGSSNWKIVKGNLASGTANDGIWEFPVSHDSLGVRRNGCDSLQFYFVAQDANTPATIVLAPEAGGVHTNVQNQVTPPSQLFGYRLKPRLRDTIYVSSSNCRYQSLTGVQGLFEQINAKKLEGDLTIIIESDLEEPGNNAITGAGLNGHRLTIRPNGTTIRTLSVPSAFTTAPTIKLDSVRNVVIDGSFNGSGRYLKFTTQLGNDKVNAPITVMNSCDSVQFLNLLFEHQPYYSMPSDASILLGSGTNRNILIQNNLFRHSVATMMPHRFIVSINGTNTAIVSKNEFSNFLNNAIEVNSPALNWKIDSNHFYRTVTPNTFTKDWAAINIPSGGFRVTNNFIGGQGPYVSGPTMKLFDNGGGIITGIQVRGSGGDSVVIDHNRIDNIEVDFTVTGAKAYTFAGIQASEAKVFVTNNIIGNPASTVATITALTSYMHGISVFGNQPVTIENNYVGGLSIKQGQLIVGTSRLVGIEKNNSSDGYYVSTMPAIIKGNTIARLNNIANPQTTTGNMSIAGTVGLLCMGGSSNLIEQNTIHDLSVKDYDVTGLHFGYCMGKQPSWIQKNRIYNLINTSNMTSSCCNDDQFNGIINGMVINADSTRLDIANNQITLTNNNIVNPVSIRGIFEIYSSYLGDERIIYNTIYIGGTASLSGGSAAIASIDNGIKHIYNNIFYNERTGGITGHFVYRSISWNTTTTFGSARLNHNLLVVQDSTFAHWGLTPRLTWNGWKTNTLGDDSSFLVSPSAINASQFFVDKNSGNLNINVNHYNSWYANNNALPQAGVDGDFDSLSVRSVVNTVPTDIGSDEFSTNAIQPGTVCSASTANFYTNVTGNTYQWQVNTGTGFTNISNNANYSGVTTSVLQVSNTPLAWDGYQYRCITNLGTSSVSTLHVVSSISTGVTISTPDLIVCRGSSANFTAAVVNEGVNPLYQWQMNGVNAGNGNGNSFNTGILTGNTQVRLLVTPDYTCASQSSSNTITLTVESPVVNAGNDQSICAGNSISIGSPAIAGYSYQWSPVTSIAAQPQVSPANTTMYVVTATNPKGCVAKDTVIVNVIPLPATPVITLSGNVLSSSAITGNQWYLDGVAISGATSKNYTALQNGVYTVKVTISGCSSQFSNAVNFVTTAVQGPSGKIQVTVTPNPASQFLWINCSGNSRLSFSLTDMTGRKLISPLTFTKQLRVDLKNIPAGIYVVEIIDERTMERTQNIIIRQ